MILLKSKKIRSCQLTTQNSTTNINEYISNADNFVGSIIGLFKKVKQLLIYCSQLDPHLIIKFKRANRANKSRNINWHYKWACRPVLRCSLCKSTYRKLAMEGTFLFIVNFIINRF
jgi:hypothetical protein